ncbi:MAG: cobalamin biosynthesis protein CbiG [Sarcina sp.]|nr:cobalamin biosynthesis protein CbiG [Sarcina sp.]
MRIVMMACTERGFALMDRSAERLAAELPEADILRTGRCAHVPGYEEGPRLSECADRWFPEADALVFFTATGIAVRCIAPHVRDKFSDPAVLAVDENGHFCISLLSGHAGGANRLCRILSRAIGAQPVITTATDGRQLFAVDVFAVENHLKLMDRAAAKRISARILAGEQAAIYIEGEGTRDDCAASVGDLSGARSTTRPETASADCLIPPEYYGSGVRRTENRREADIIVSFRRLADDPPQALYLVPACVVLGIGCRRGASCAQIRELADRVLEETGVFREALCALASIDLKQDEPGLLEFASEWGLPAFFYSADRLNALPGSFTASDFVRKVTGTDNVCERSALCRAGDHAGLILPKTGGNGATAALACMKIFFPL